MNEQQLKGIANEMVDKFDHEKYDLPKRKELAIRAIGMVRAELLKGENYDEMPVTLDNLTQIKNFIKEI